MNFRFRVLMELLQNDLGDERRLASPRRPLHEQEVLRTDSAPNRVPFGVIETGVEEADLSRVSRKDSIVGCDYQTA